MTQEQIVRRMETDKQTPKHLCRLYLFACASSLPESFLSSMRQTLCGRLGVDEEHFYLLFAETCSQWQIQTDRIQLEAGAMPGIARFEKQYKGHPAPGISLGKAARLQTSLCGLALQKFSIQTGKNHLKSRDLQHFCSLVNPGGELAAFEPIFFRPFRKALDGQWKVSGEEFLLTTLMHAQLLADYLQADFKRKKDKGETDQTAKKEIVREFIHASRHMSRKEIQQFLSGEPLETRVDTIVFPGSIPKKQP